MVRYKENSTIPENPYFSRIILYLLSFKSKKNIYEISKITTINRAMLTYRLKELYLNGVLTREKVKEGKRLKVYYSLNESFLVSELWHLYLKNIKFAISKIKRINMLDLEKNPLFSIINQNDSHILYKNITAIKEAPKVLISDSDITYKTYSINKKEFITCKIIKDSLFKNFDSLIPYMLFQDVTLEPCYDDILKSFVIVGQEFLSGDVAPNTFIEKVSFIYTLFANEVYFVNDLLFYRFLKNATP